MGDNKVNKKLEQILLGRKGGRTTAKVIKELYHRPFNNNQLALKLNINYKAISYHIGLLEENEINEPKTKEYGSLNFLTEYS